jgi:hypothetical protein
MSNPFEFDIDSNDRVPARGTRTSSSGKWKPHQGPRLYSLGIASLIVAPWLVAPCTWLMARACLAEMDAGRMDPAGRPQTETARKLAKISTIFWYLFLVCWLGYQAIVGGPFLSAIGSQRITKAQFNRVQPDMSKKQVLDLLGPPARTSSNQGRPTWHWLEKNGPATFLIEFNEHDRVGARGWDTPD